MLENTSKPLRRLAIIIEFLVALAVLISGALKLLPFGGVPGLVVIGVVSVCLRRKGLRGIGLEGRPGLAQQTAS